MDKFFNKTNTILLWVVVVLCFFVVGTILFSNSSKSDVISANAEVNPTVAQIENGIITQTSDEAVVETTEEVATTVQPTTESEETTAEPTETAETTEPTTQEPTVVFATAIPVDNPASHQEQWDAGYLVAIDNPDTIYECSQVTLSDSDRDLLERLCYGEFGSGGFVGACLIAQSVKDAMCFDGYESVQAVIDNYHYTGSTTSGKNEDCVNAVKYIFDENHDAVQHRLLYMYNPDLVQSAFHESQNYILTYGGVRFFDRWGY